MHRTFARGSLRTLRDTISILLSRMLPTTGSSFPGSLSKSALIFNRRRNSYSRAASYELSTSSVRKLPSRTVARAHVQYYEKTPGRIRPGVRTHTGGSAKLYIYSPSLSRFSYTYRLTVSYLYLEITVLVTFSFVWPVRGQRCASVAIPKRPNGVSRSLFKYAI